MVKVERLDVVPGVAECFSKVLCHKQFHLFILPIMNKEPPCENMHLRSFSCKIVLSTFQLFIKLEMSGRELSFVSRNSFSTVESDKHMPATLFDILCCQTLNFHTCAECQ